MKVSEQLLKGFPVNADVILPWHTPISELRELGHPKYETWKRWDQGRDGHYKEIQKSRLLWTKIQLPGLASIEALNIDFENQDAIFIAADLYFTDREQLEQELTEQLGTPFINRIEFMEKDGLNEQIQKQWIIKSSDTKTKVSFLLDGVFKVKIEDLHN